MAHKLGTYLVAMTVAFIFSGQKTSVCAMQNLDAISVHIYDQLLCEGWAKLTIGDASMAAIAFNKAANLANRDRSSTNEIKAGNLADCALGLYLAGPPNRIGSIKVLMDALDCFDEGDEYFLRRGRIHHQISAVYDSMQMWADAAFHLRKSIEMFDRVPPEHARIASQLREDLDKLLAKIEANISGYFAGSATVAVIN